MRGWKGKKGGEEAYRGYDTRKEEKEKRKMEELKRKETEKKEKLK